MDKTLTAKDSFFNGDTECSKFGRKAVKCQVLLTKRPDKVRNGDGGGEGGSSILVRPWGALCGRLNGGLSARGDNEWTALVRGGHYLYSIMGYMGSLSAKG